AVGEDSAGARLVAHAQRIKGVKSVGAELDARADLGDLRRLFQNLDLEALTHQCQRGGKTTNAAASNQYGKRRLIRVHHRLRNCMLTVSIRSISIVIR